MQTMCGIMYYFKICLYFMSIIDIGAMGVTKMLNNIAGEKHPSALDLSLGKVAQSPHISLFSRG